MRPPTCQACSALDATVNITIAFADGPASTFVCKACVDELDGRRTVAAFCSLPCDPRPDGYAATVETRNFTFHASGRTETDAICALRWTFEDHIEDRAPANPLRWSQIADGVRVSPIRFGQGEVS